jgi:hypothetical protein
MKNLGTINGSRLHLSLSPSEVESVINALAFYSEALGREPARLDFWEHWRDVARESLPEWSDSLASRIASASQEVL